ncbi:MAG: hypothetical protein HOC72_06625, partial [Rhodospirillaceae bacterium]|nr:hypothetical protein [Rhodospirillaceae bacterium]
MIFLFESSNARDGVEPVSPWIFVVVSGAILAVLLTAHRIGRRGEAED